MEVKQSIGVKIRRMILLTSITVVLLTVLSFFLYEISSFRRSHMENISNLASIVADNLTASLAFDDNKEGNRLLNTLRAEPSIQLAVAYDHDGNPFAVYSGSKQTNAIPPVPKSDGAYYTKGRLVVVAPSIEKNRVGTLYLEADLSPLYNRLLLYMGIVALVLVGAFLVAYLLSSSLQRRITGPILSLADTARYVSLNRDYSVRAKKTTHDEIGALTTAFNHMLTQISERDQALSQSSERLRMALDASQTGTWNWDLVTGLITWDEHLHRIYGLKPGEFNGTLEQTLSLIHTEDRASVKWTIERALEKRRDLFFEFRTMWPDGSVHYLSSRGRALFDDQGKAVRMTGVTIDVTESKVAEQALRESEERFRNMADAAPVLIWTAGIEKTRNYFNRAWIEFTGRAFAEELGEGWRRGIHPEDTAATMRSYQDALAQEKAFHLEYRLRRADGEFGWIVDQGVPRFAPDGSFRGFIGSCIDITERKLAQEELENRVQARTAELAETNRELEAFTYSVSHDLRSPLRHINAYAQIVQEEFGKAIPEEAHRYLDRIRHGAKNMGNLVDDLLNLARVGRQELTHQPCDPNQLLHDIIIELKSEIGDRHIEWQLGKLSPGDCDPGLIKQVFANLLGNAVKYTRPREKAVITVGEFERDGERVIFVKDNGVGFNMKYAHKLFGVFQRLHRPDEFEGTGVGLATVERIIRKHGGRIWAEAELDKGAAFYFTLPRAEQSIVPENANLERTTA
jgi:PAS domain S-box-containing protein